MTKPDPVSPITSSKILSSTAKSHSKHMSITAKTPSDSISGQKTHTRRLSMGAALSSRPKLAISTSTMLSSDSKQKSNSLKTAPPLTLRASKIPSPLPPTGNPRSSTYDTASKKSIVKKGADPTSPPRRRMSLAVDRPGKLKDIASKVPGPDVIDFAEASKKLDEERRAALGLTSFVNGEYNGKVRARSLSTAIRTKSLNSASMQAPSWIASGTKEELTSMVKQKSKSPPPLSAKSAARNRSSVTTVKNNSSAKRASDLALSKNVTFERESSRSPQPRSVRAHKDIPEFSLSSANDETASLVSSEATSRSRKKVVNGIDSHSLSGNDLSNGLRVIETTKSVISEPPPNMRRLNRGSVADGASFTSEPERPRFKQPLAPKGIYGNFVSFSEFGRCFGQIW